MFRRALRGAFLAAGFFAAKCCRSSGVEHSLGKGEVECSNHSGSTSFLHKNQYIGVRILLSPWRRIARSFKECRLRSVKNP